MSQAESTSDDELPPALDEAVGEGEPVDEVAAEGDEPEVAEELVITLGDEPAEASEEDESRAPTWVRDLRKQNREKDRALREKDAEIARLKGAPSQPAAVVVGDEPTFEGCEYDEAKFKAEVGAWHARKREAEEQQAARTRAENEQRTKWQGRIDAVTKASTTLKVPDLDDAVDTFENTFSVVQQGIIVVGPDDPKVSAQLRYALGRNPKKAKELAAISDPVKFTLAIGDIMTKLKVTTRTAPPPETVVRSTVAGAAAVDNQLNKLRAEAEKTGNYTKVMAYKNQRRQTA